MSCINVNTPRSQPILPGGLFQRIGKTGGEVLLGTERLLLAAGLVCLMVYVCDRMCAIALNKVGLWSSARSVELSGRAENVGDRDSHGDGR